jgi:hypothetical protein
MFVRHGPPRCCRRSLLVRKVVGPVGPLRVTSGPCGNVGELLYQVPVGWPELRIVPQGAAGNPLSAQFADL